MCTTTVCSSGSTASATLLMAASGVAITSRSTPRAAAATLSPRPRMDFTSHPASVSAAASERPARPGPISLSVVTGPLSAIQPVEVPVA